MATPQQVARLAAGAQGGTAGVAEFDQAAKQVQASRDQAIGQMSHASSALMAPGALAAQLQGNLRTSAQGALSDLGQYSGAASAADAQDQAGTANYINEANAAIPLINAYSNQDLQQKIAMLAAQRARSTGRSGTSTPLSDSQLRTDLLGLAQLNRQQAGAQQNASYQADLAHLDAVAAGGPTGPNALAPDQILNTAPAIGPVGPQGPQGPPGAVGFLGSLLSPLPAAWKTGVGVPPGAPATAPPPTLVNSPAAVQSNFKGELDQQAQARQLAVQKIMNDLHGPGITDEAIQQGLNIPGIDPNRLYGLLTPQVDAAYVRAQEFAGNYKNPNDVTTTNQLLAPDAAAQQAGSSGVKGINGPLPPPVARQAMTSTFYDWTGDKKLNAAFKTWATGTGAGAIRSAGADLNAQHQAYINNSPDAGQHQTNYLADLVANARSAIKTNVGFDGFRQTIAASPIFADHPAEMAIAFAMVKPLFDAATVAATKTTKRAPTPGY